MPWVGFSWPHARQVLTTELAPVLVLIALLAYRQTHTNVDHPKPAILVLTVRLAPQSEEAILEEVTPGC